MKVKKKFVPTAKNNKKQKIKSIYFMFPGR